MTTVQRLSHLHSPRTQPYPPALRARHPHPLRQELIKSNNNGYRGSQRLYKDAGGPLNFGPPWDFNGKLKLAYFFEGGGRSEQQTAAHTLPPPASWPGQPAHLCARARLTAHRPA